jgi:DNA-binding transcriptional ArsR family regulator
MTAAELTPDEFAAAVAAVTSAFGDPTRREIYLFVRTHPEGVKAAEVAEQFALHPNVARHHLEKLCGGRLRRRQIGAPRAPGRPSKRYQASTRDTHLAFPPRRDDLLGTLLARALGTVAGRGSAHDRGGGRLRVRPFHRGSMEPGGATARSRRRWHRSPAR